MKIIQYSHGHERRPVDLRVVDLHAAIIALRHLGRGDIYHVGHRGQERAVRCGRVARSARHRDVRVRRRELQLLQRLMMMRVLLLLLLLMVLLLLLLPCRWQRVESVRRPAAATTRAVGRAEYGVDPVAVPEAVDVLEREGLGGVGGVAAPAQSLERLPQERVQPEMAELYETRDT